MFQGKLEEAGPLYQRALAIDEKVYGPDHPDVAGALNNWAQLLNEQVRDVNFSGKFLLVPDRFRKCSTTGRGCWRVR